MLNNDFFFHRIQKNYAHKSAADNRIKNCLIDILPRKLFNFVLFKEIIFPGFKKQASHKKKIGTSVVGFSTGEFLKSEFPYIHF